MKKITLRGEGDPIVDSKFPQACGVPISCSTVALGRQLRVKWSSGQDALKVKEPSPHWVLEDYLQPHICKPPSAAQGLSHALPHLTRAVL